MKKRLLLSLTALVAFSATAQQKNEYVKGLIPFKFKKTTESRLDFLFSNESNKKSISLKSTTNISNDTVATAFGKYNLAYMLDNNMAAGGSYLLGAFTNQTNNQYIDLTSARQFFPLNFSVELKEVGLYLKADNLNDDTGTGSGDVKIYGKDYTELATAEFVADSAAYSTVWVDFSASQVTLTDSFYIVIEPKNLSDKITMFYTGDVSNLGANIENSNARFDVVTRDPANGYAVTDYNPYVLEFDNTNAVPLDADWFIFPLISHSINTQANSSVSCLTAGNLSVDFDFVSADTAAITNPIYNVNAFINNFVSNDFGNRYYATANFDNTTSTEVDTLFSVNSGTDFTFSHTYSSTGTKNVEVTQYYKSWGYLAGAVTYTSSSSVTLACANIDELNANTFVVYPNPASGLVNVSLNNVNGTISLLSADGKVIESREVSSNTETFNVGSLKAGVYFIQVGQSVKKLMVK